MGEAEAQALLERRGYRIVDINVRFGRAGEIDVIAWDGETLAFIEVKTRRGRGQMPVEAVTPAKQRQIARLAVAYCARHEMNDEVAVRFDVVGVTLGGPDGAERVLAADLRRGAFLAPEET